MKNSKGITLISLIITIIVLFILAGVSIATLTGENGLIAKANLAKKETEKSANEEKERLELFSNYKTNQEFFSNIYENTEIYIDKNNKTAPIPEGFAVGISNTINKIENGLVITDAIDENHKSIGNEFVWIPVDSMEQFKRVEGYASGNLQNRLEKCTEPYQNASTEEREAYTAMYESVKANQGFYIGRYEAGKEDGNVVVKKQQLVYNNVKWANSMTDLKGGAVQIAKDFINDKSYNSSVISTLCYGVQWDATLKFFEDDTYLIDSNQKGWYKDNYEKGNLEHKTGIDVDDKASNKIKNIYDMAGNVIEWTMEAFNIDLRVYRGGTYTNSSFEFPASIRNNYKPDETYDRVGFRITLHFPYKET